MQWDSEIKEYFQWFCLIMTWIVGGILVLAFIGWLLSHVHSPQSNLDKAVQSCVNRGGVPQTRFDSGHEEYLQTCQFK